MKEGFEKVVVVEAIFVSTSVIWMVYVTAGAMPKSIRIKQCHITWQPPVNTIVL